MEIISTLLSDTKLVLKFASSVLINRTKINSVFLLSLFSRKTKFNEISLAETIKIFLFVEDRKTLLKLFLKEIYPFLKGNFSFEESSS